jgi:tetratricopeptide (TPR) repeat protein
MKSLHFSDDLKDTEAYCEVLQHLGINRYLMGRDLRRDILEEGLCLASDGVQEQCLADLEEAAHHQLIAWADLTKALNLAQDTDWRAALASGCHRLAKVYREIHRIEELFDNSPNTIRKSKNLKENLKELQSKAADYGLPFEVAYEDHFENPGPFEELNWMNRALRLFRLSVFFAEEVDDFHRALDALTEIARIYIERGEVDYLQAVLNEVEKLAGRDYQEQLFTAMNEIAWGDFYFIQNKFDKALEQYQVGYANLARESGYASYLLADRLRDLHWRLESLPAQKALRWVSKLEDVWEEAVGDKELWSNMLRFVEEERQRLLYRL